MHISKIISSISKINGLLFSLKNIFPTDCLVKLYYAFAFPHINLHILTWGSAPPTHLNALQVAQNNLMRNIFRTNSINFIYNQTGILNINSLYNLKLAVFMFQQLLGNDLFSPLLRGMEWGHTYNTRRINVVRRPLARVSFNQRFWFSRGLRLWDSLPIAVKNSLSVKQFRKRYRALML